MNKYEQLLDLFVSKDPTAYREWLRTPFHIEGDTIATDAHSLCSVPEIIGEYNRLKDDRIESQTKELLCLKPNMNFEILVTTITENLKTVEEVPAKKFTGSFERCEECKGTGQVEWIYTDSKGEDYADDFDCPKCDGSAFSENPATKITGGKVPDPDAFCLIGECVFRIEALTKLVSAAKILRQSSVTLVCQTAPVKNNIFKVGNCTILLMPCYRMIDGEDAKIEFAIPIL